MRRVLIVSALMLLATLLAAAGIAAWARWSLGRPFHGYPEAEKRVDLASGLDARQILERLEAEGVLANALLARIYLVWRLHDPPLKAGEYRFSGAPSTLEVLDKLVRGEVMSHTVTLIEGLTLEETARHLAASGFGRQDALVSAMSRPDEIADLDPAADDLEGYLFPDTYAFARDTPEAVVVATLVRTFRQRFQDQVLPLLPEEAERSLREVVTLASIVEKEATLDDERPTIAGVYANRLRRGMALYADPTIIFALKRLGRWDGNLRRPDLKLDTPYNTYLYPGLPPGPIASPGLASLRAAAAPAEVPYLYFVSRNDGSHVFARTLAEHNRNVERWQRRYWRERWARERSANGS